MHVYREDMQAAIGDTMRHTNATNDQNNLYAIVIFVDSFAQTGR